MNRAERPLFAPASLLVAAAIWGVIWYPYRVLEEAGLSGSASTVLTYLVAMGLGLSLLRRVTLWPRPYIGMLLLVALVAGATNLAYVLAVIGGEIMRVMLLFYLAPLWTLLFARLILEETAGRLGLAILLLSLAGAFVMLGGFSGNLPLPGNAAEWLGLASGMGFALVNVLSRRLREVPGITRSLWMFAGVVLVAALPVGLSPAPFAALAPDPGLVAWIVLTGMGLVLATFTVQYGLARVPANRAIVLLLSELVVAALASWWLAGETMRAQEWLGGAMIVAATLLSGRMERNEPA